MKSRGAALPTVLALVSLVLVIGLAMASLSTLSLHFSRRQSDRLSCELAARSALAEFLGVIQANNALSTLNPLKPDPIDLPVLFPNGLRGTHGRYETSIFFGSADGYSSDNLAGEEPRHGWPEAGGDGEPGVPPYSVDVIINVRKPSQEIIRFRAILTRVWPFAVYVDQGPLTITGKPGTDREHFSTVIGDVFTAWRGAAEGGSASYSIGRGYGLGTLDQPSKLLANLEAGAGYLPNVPIKHHLIIGSINHYNGEPRSEVLTSSDEEVAYSKLPAALNPRMQELDANYTDPTFGTPDTDVGAVSSFGNILKGDFVDDHEFNVEIPPIIIGVTGPAPPPLGATQPNSFQGAHHVRSGIALDPLAEIRNDDDPLAAFQGSNQQSPGISRPTDDEWLDREFSLDPSSPDLTRDGGGVEPYILRETLELSNGTFEVNGSVSNRQVIYHNGESDASKKGLYLREFRAGLVLQDATLLVDGDLNLGASGFEDPALAISPEQRTIPISGSGSTLVVTGQLILGNSSINAGDRSFVIYAKDIVLKGGGTFHGLLLAENSITILTQAEETLDIKGALLCAGEGGITVRGAKITHEPRYLKAINGGGDFHLALWRRL